MGIGTRIRELRVQRGLSQGDIEQTTGLLRCYISRVEHGHTVPSLETLERFAAAFQIPLYRFFYSGEDLPSSNAAEPKTLERLAEEAGPEASDARFLLKLRGLLGNIGEPERELLFNVARRLTAAQVQ